CSALSSFPQRFWRQTLPSGDLQVWSCSPRGFGGERTGLTGEGGQETGVRTCLLTEDEGLKQGLSQNLCSFCSPHSHLCRLVSAESGNQDGSPRCCGKAFLGGADTYPLAACCFHLMV
ncbi:mCG145574, partial [Mus musculus]